jgi:multidrug efflux pump subunit AcrA (membrane-fusion protein)
VARGTALASLYAVDWAEVRLQVPDEALAHLGIPLDFHVSEADVGAAPPVELSAKVAGRDARWRGSIQRTEGQVDPRSRMVTLVARVADPYGRQTPSAVPLAAGLFVSARIAGRAVEGVYELPGVALRNGERVWVVDSEERLRFRPVELLRRGHDSVVIATGLRPGERVCVSPLEAVTDGMRVRVNPSASSPSASG